MGETSFNLDKPFTRPPRQETKIGKVPGVLGTKEDYKIPTESKSEQMGHRAEVEIRDFLSKLPGVDEVRLSNNVEDASKVDLFVRMKGDYKNEIKLQLTARSNKTPKGLPKDIVFIKFRPEDVRDGEVSPELLKIIAAKILERMPWDQKQGLMNYHRIDY